APRQELASHTFSHYYCLEDGQDAAAFRADLESAVRIADHAGVRLHSIVFPRNQLNPAYTGVLRELGFTAYRGNQAGFLHAARREGDQRRWVRALRLADAYVSLSGPSLVAWDDVVDDDGLANVAASRFLRPY